MKAIITAALLIFIIGNIPAVDTGSYQFIDYIRAISSPQKPEIYDDGVVFTVSSEYHRVGISFAHEGYAKVHWLMRLMIPGDNAQLSADGNDTENTAANVDSGIMFHVEPIPFGFRNMDYRLVIDGVWTSDPLNPLFITGASGIVESRVVLPPPPRNASAPAPGTYRFTYHAPPGEIVTVGGSFNNWDPFMYELKEISPGFYTLTLPIGSETFQYLFYHRGDEIPDPANSERLYSRSGRIVSVGSIQSQ